ncbi:unnamed protein product [Dovyalis caffra]|uniref:Uncharacterized protein n=1 Tax=Dovyalis caffra TaxID=77055 RepID=A0AAV1RHV3_9ROSI|nr:unnamed protein product [Dovyalis caffra]
MDTSIADIEWTIDIGASNHMTRKFGKRISPIGKTRDRRSYGTNVLDIHKARHQDFANKESKMLHLIPLQIVIMTTLLYLDEPIVTESLTHHDNSLDTTPPSPEVAIILDTGSSSSISSPLNSNSPLHVERVQPSISSYGH